MVNNNDVIILPRSVVEQALEALTNCTSEYGHRCNRCDSEVDPEGNVASALRAALEPQVEQEPVELRHLRALNQELLEALEKISAIENQEYGADWEEIEEARDIADAAIAKATGETKLPKY